jgi:hypothetical protein
MHNKRVKSLFLPENNKIRQRKKKVIKSKLEGTTGANYTPVAPSLTNKH